MKFTNFGKKMFALLAVVVLALVVASCGDKKKNDEKEQHQANVNAVLDMIFFDQTQLDEVKGNLTFVNKNGKYPDVAISWTTTELDIVAADGTVKRPGLDDPRIKEGTEYVEVKATVTASQGEATGSKSFDLKVYGEVKTDVSSVQSIKKSFYTLMQNEGLKYSDKTSEMGIQAEVTGEIVVVIKNKGYLVNDGAGVIYVYTNATTDKQVGDVIKASGLVYAFYGLIELTKPTIVDADKEVADPVFEETTVSEYTAKLDNALDAEGKIVDVDAFMGFSTAPLKLYAKVEKGDKGSGDTYYLADPETGKSVAIYHYCTDSEADAAKIDAFVGKYVYINVYSFDVHEDLTDKYRVVWDGSAITEAEAPELTDTQKVENTLAGLAVEKTVLEDLVLPTADGVVWTLKAASENATVEAGTLKVTRPAYGAGDAKVTVVATCTIGEVTKTKEFEVTILESFDPTISEIKTFNADTTYKLGVYQANLYQYLFITGEMSGDYGKTADNAALAAGIKVVTVEGGYKLQVIVGETTKYLEIYEKENNKGEIKQYVNIVDSSEAVWQYNEEYNTFTMTIGEDTYYVGIYGTFNTLSASKISYAKSSFVSHLYEAEGTEVKEPEPTGDFAMDFGTSAQTGYAANKELTVGDVTFTAHWTQIATSDKDPHAATGAFAVLCPVRKNNETKQAYLEFSLTEAASKLTFDASWWSAKDKENAAKIVKFEVQYSADGENWTTIDLGSVANIADDKYTEFSVDLVNAKFVRILVEGDAVYDSNQSVRIAIDNVEISK